VILGLRPTDFELAGPGTDPALPRMRATVDVVEKLGSESHLIFSVDAPRVSTEAVRAAQDAEGHDEGVLLADDQRSEFTARIDGRHDVRPGETVEHGALHVFDIETGLALRGGDAAPGPVAAEPATVGA
jgi:multiple sugar transport system ATP-binding protein